MPGVEPRLNEPYHGMAQERGSAHATKTENTACNVPGTKVMQRAGHTSTTRVRSDGRSQHKMGDKGGEEIDGTGQRDLERQQGGRLGDTRTEITNGPRVVSGRGRSCRERSSWAPHRGIVCVCVCRMSDSRRGICRSLSCFPKYASLGQAALDAAAEPVQSCMPSLAVDWNAQVISIDFALARASFWPDLVSTAYSQHTSANI